MFFGNDDGEQTPCVVAVNEYCNPQRKFQDNPLQDASAIDYRCIVGGRVGIADNTIIIEGKNDEQHF